MRPIILVLAACLALGACSRQALMTAPTPATIDVAKLDREAGLIAARIAPGVLGAALIDLQTGEVWSLHGARRFPLQSVFKAPLGAAVLAEVDAGRLRLDETLTLTDSDLSPSHSPVADAYPDRKDYTVAELLERAVGASDNTAADVLMARIGGPGALTAWLRGKRIENLRVDRYERQLQPEITGLASFRPAWKGEAAYRAALAQTTPQAQLAATRAYLTDPRDTATPRGMAAFLAGLQRGELLSPESTVRLLRIMTETQSGPNRLRAGLPPGASLAHKTGTARTIQGINPATNDAGILTLADGRRFGVVAFVSGATAPEAEREAVIADLMKAIAASLR